MRLIVAADGLGVLQAHLSELYRRLDGDLSEPLNAVAGVLEDSTRERFERETDPQGKKWADLNENTLKAKAKKGSAEHGILTDEGHLRNILSEVTKNQALVGTAQPYAVFHQDGTKNMPSRPIFGISAEDEEEIGDRLAEWLDKLWSNPV
ncbi:phage virion morphogenesis protein [Neisseria perflava]|uniref:phage virion morphogenesis protein n=1 Tax=Neisseria perflava TaxID=33053 RepID=UPI0020A0E2A7|nr:phage virion morphogenesis protein [Neisseria perflava]MCP1659340.1 phage virion morphogenesis protein [Neisseria perflava]